MSTKLGKPALLAAVSAGLGVVAVLSHAPDRAPSAADATARSAPSAPASGAPSASSTPVSSSAAVPAGSIDVISLLNELVDLPRLAQAPDPPYVAHLASSYDRRSRSPADGEAWFANDDWASRDRPNYVRMEVNGGRREYVLLDTKGPGAIVRLWSATPTGVLRIYLDGEGEPAIAASLEQLLTGRDRFPGAYAYVAARGYNSYFPIPYEKSCKVTIDEIVASDPFRGGPLEKFYYQIHYRTYSAAAAARVRSFSDAELERARPTIGQIARVLTTPSLAYEPGPARAVAPLASTGDGAELVLESTAGGSIRELALRLPDTSDGALRRARLALSFDDEPAIDVPLGDFFGGGPGLSPYDSLPFSVGADGSFVSRWPMPFAYKAVIAVRGCPGAQGEVSVEPARPGAGTRYFRAEWRPAERVATRPFRDLTLLDARGEGLFVGSAFALDNPAGARWWGEGDEKFYVDGESFPSLFGTGTEDFYGYAWSTTELFSRAFHAQPRAEGPGFGGRCAVNRFHTLDAIPFSRALRFDLELWHWEETTIDYSAMVYFYSRRVRE